MLTNGLWAILSLAERSSQFANLLLSENVPQQHQEHSDTFSVVHLVCSLYCSVGSVVKGGPARSRTNKERMSL